MNDKELVFKMYETALSFYETSNIPEYFIGALDTVVASLSKHDITPDDICQDSVREADWKTIVYQIMFDLKRAWAISSEFDEKEDKIGQSQLSEELCIITRKCGYEFHNNGISAEFYNKVKEKYGLK